MNATDYSFIRLIQVQKTGKGTGAVLQPDSVNHPMEFGLPNWKIKFHTGDFYKQVTLANRP